MSKDFEELGEQIGNAGGEYTEDGVHVLGHMEHIGKSPSQELTQEEADSKAAFLERTNKQSSFGQHRTFGETQEPLTFDIRDGWTPIDRNRMGIRSQFYPEDWQFRVKPATVEAIKNWSSIDEENIAVTNNVFNEVMKSCVSISTPTGKLSWGKINSWDRFWFIMMIREYTFVKGEAALNYDEDCPECGSNITFNLDADSLVYEFPDDSIIDKYWNAEERVWIIDPKEYDLDEPVQRLYVPTLEKDEAILQWAYAQSQLGKTLSEPFLRFLPWLLQKTSKDPQLFEKFVKEAKKVFDSWDTEMFSFMDEVLRNITINPSEKLKQICPNCGEEVRTTVRFPNGIKHIFAVQSRHRKFGTK